MNDEEKIIKFKGSLNKIIFPKDEKTLGNENTYGITSWEIIETLENLGESLILRNDIILVGEYPTPLSYDSIYTILAKEVYHPKYGKQYQVIYYVEDIDFSSVKGQKGFLKQILTPLQIEEMFKIYDNPLEIIANHDIERLKKVHGIGDYIANRIIRSFEEKKDLSVVYIKLDKLGLTANFINKLIKTYKNPQLIINVVESNPYRLVYDVEGVSFITADKIALKTGIVEQSEERIKAFIVWYLEQQGELGNSYITAGELTSAIFYYLGKKEELLLYYSEDVQDNNLNNAIQQLIEEEEIVLEDTENKSKRRVYLKKYWYLEKNIVKELKRILNSKDNMFFNNFEEKIKACEEKQGFEFTDEQIEGIKLGLNNQICLITGPAGSGKSSLVSGILSVLNEYTFAQCALSGRAAARLQEITGESGSTIHRLLEYNPETQEFLYNENNFLKHNIIILDEISLVGGEIFLDLLKAIPCGAKLYMLGDDSQLEAIGALNLAADMIKSKEIPTVSLEKVHRQAKKSGILTTAYDVRNQIQLFEDKNFEGKVVRGELKDMLLDVSPNRDNNLEKIKNYFIKAFEGETVKKDIMKIQVLAPVKERGDCCVFNLNNVIQELYNPIKNDNPYIKIRKNKDENGNERSFIIQENDKVMCIKNNYRINSPGGNKVSIFNGWIGLVTKILDDMVYINFPLNKVSVAIEKNEIGKYFELGYACTTHKFQGSDCPFIIGVIDYSTPPQMLTKQLVYTLITRAKIKCVLVAQTGALRKAISTNFVSSKRTFLPELLVKNS